MRITVTSALPYVNGVKHLGNIVGSILPADIFHRFLDLYGVDNIFICGTDDHGTAIEIGAANENTSPEEYVKKYHKLQNEIYKKWNFDFTHFGRTSSQSNHELTQEIFNEAYKNGYIVKESMIIPYCNNCKKFLPDRYTLGTCPACDYEAARGDQCEKCGRVLDPEELKDPKCSLCGHNSIEFRNEKHLFLNFTALQSKLKEWIENNKHWPDNTRNFALGWIREGLKPRCITRNLKWGINVPLKGYEHLVFYVWFDAPIGYISITKDGVKDWKKWWTDSKIYHFLGKDNVPFHTIFWPGTLMAAGGLKYQLPYHIEGYEYLNWEGEKFSTSRGVGLFSDEALDLFPADYWRFYLASILPESKDSNFDWKDFQARINNELIGNYGNLFYRATFFVEKNFNGAVPEVQPEALGEAAHNLHWELGKTIHRVRELVDQVKLREALREILALASKTNKYFQDQKPWATTDSADTLYTTINMLNALSLLMKPYIPSAAGEAIECLGNHNELSQDFVIKPGCKIKAKLLFKKIEDIDIEKAGKYKTKYAKSDQVDTIDLVNDMMPFEEFQKVEMRVGTVIGIEDHPKADKLYILQVDLGEEKRQIVAGLRERYTKEELEGKQIIVVTNLEPKELRGVKSHGMLLAADDGTILSPSSEVENGSKIR